MFAVKISAAQIASCPTCVALKRRDCRRVYPRAAMATAKFPEWRYRGGMNRTNGLIGKGDDEHQCVGRRQDLKVRLVGTLLDGNM
jgi:hypothetical protein